MKELLEGETREFPSRIVALGIYIVKYFIESLSNRMNQKDIKADALSYSGSRWMET